MFRGLYYRPSIETVRDKLLHQPALTFTHWVCLHSAFAEEMHGKTTEYCTKIKSMKLSARYAHS